MKTLKRTQTFIVGIAFAALACGGLPVAADPTQVARGKQVYDYWCGTCHAPDPREGGRLLPGTAALAVKYHGLKPAALEARDDLAPDFTKYVIRHGIKGMPFFRKTEISDQDMQAIAAYLARNMH